MLCMYRVNQRLYKLVPFHHCVPDNERLQPPMYCAPDQYSLSTRLFNSFDYLVWLLIPGTLGMQA